MGILNSPQVLLVIQVLFLPRAIGTQVPSVISSLEQAGREAACPRETVTLTCTTYGSPQLQQWYFGGQNARFVSPPDNVGKILSRQGFNATLESVNNNGLTSSLTTVFHVNYNRSYVKCSDGRINTTKTLIAAGIPSPPTGFSVEETLPMCHHTDVIFTWNPPEYSGKASITMYTLTVSNSVRSAIGEELSLTVTLLNGATYQAHLTASNCIGDSSPVHLDLSITGCVSPPHLERGMMSSSCTGENTIVQYQCDDELVLLGGSEVTCMKDGNWNPNPYELTCKANCGVIDHLNHGELIYNSSNTLEGSVVSLSCNDGYSIQGTNSLDSTCGSNGMWSPDPDDVICRAVCMTPQAPINGTLIAVSDLVEGAVAEYKCDEGKFPKGNLMAMCTDTGNGGEWIPDPANEKCRDPAFCSCTVPQNAHLLAQSLQLPTEGHDGDYLCQASATEGTWLNGTEGHSAVYFCQTADGIWINKTTTCSSKGTWTPKVQCTRQESQSVGVNVSTLVAAMMSSVVATAVVSLLLGCLLMWCMTLKRTHTATDSESSPMEVHVMATTEPYYEDIAVEERFKISTNTAYAKSELNNKTDP